MNNSNACANNLAQSNQTAHLLERANQESFNWAPLVRFITKETDPCELETNLLELYFGVAELITDNVGNEAVAITSNQLWYLRQLIESVKAIHSGENSEVIFVANDNTEINHSINADLQEVNMLNRLVKEYEQRLIEQGKEIGRYMYRVECLQQQVTELTGTEASTK